MITGTFETQTQESDTSHFYCSKPVPCTHPGAPAAVQKQRQVLALNPKTPPPATRTPEGICSEG